MVDVSLLQLHHQRQLEIASIENENERRKNLIKMAVLKVFHVSKANVNIPTKTVNTPNARVEDLTRRNHEYELTINKLKQQITTKEKLQESKLEALREEITKFRQQLKEQPPKQFQGPTLSRFQPKLDPGMSRPSSAFSTSPYVNKTMFNHGGEGKSYLSPTINSLNKSVFSDSKSSILSPIQNKRKVLLPTKAKREYTNYNSMKKQFQDSNRLEQTKETTPPPRTPDYGGPVTRSVARQSSPAMTPPRSTTKEMGGDRSSGSPAPPTLDFTPSKVPHNGKLFEDHVRSLDEVINKSFTSVNNSEAESETPDANSTTIEATTISPRANRPVLPEDDALTSANSSIANPMMKKDKKKKKKLKLWKSEVSRASTSSPVDKKHKSHSTALHLEDDDLNTLNYYQDENFLNENINITPKISKKRVLEDELAIDPPTFNKKKKKNVFKID